MRDSTTKRTTTILSYKHLTNIFSGCGDKIVSSWKGLLLVLLGMSNGCSVDDELYVEYAILKVVDYICIGFEYAAMAASLNASLSVGYTRRCQIPKVEGGKETYVCVTRPSNIFSARTILNRQHPLCDHLTGVWPYIIIQLVTTQPKRLGKAHAPMMCTPNILSVSFSVTIFTKPSVSRFVFARELAEKLNFPTLYCTPAALSSCSVLPTQDTSG